jgi:hypothetical protein
MMATFVFGEGEGDEADGCGDLARVVAGEMVESHLDGLRQFHNVGLIRRTRAV